MVVTIPIAFFEPTTGELRNPPWFSLMWAAIAGIVIIVIYSSYKERQERRKANARRRSRK
jgi:hypothetical protein